MGGQPRLVGQLQRPCVERLAGGAAAALASQRLADGDRDAVRLADALRHRADRIGARAVGLVQRPIICVGALLDFVAAKVPRAPDMVRRMRLEWAFRLAQEPRRLAGRYLVGNATFLAGMIVQKLTGTRI